MFLLFKNPPEHLYHYLDVIGQTVNITELCSVVLHDINQLVPQYKNEINQWIAINLRIRWRLKKMLFMWRCKTRSISQIANETTLSLCDSIQEMMTENPDQLVYIYQCNKYWAFHVSEIQRFFTSALLHYSDYGYPNGFSQPKKHILNPYTNNPFHDGHLIAMYKRLVMYNTLRNRRVPICIHAFRECHFNHIYLMGYHGNYLQLQTRLQQLTQASDHQFFNAFMSTLNVLNIRDKFNMQECYQHREWIEPVFLQHIRNDKCDISYTSKRDIWINLLNTYPQLISRSVVNVLLSPPPPVQMTRSPLSTVASPTRPSRPTRPLQASPTRPTSVPGRGIFTNLSSSDVEHTHQLRFRR